MTRLIDIPIPDELLARARRADETAQAEIYSAVAPALFAFIRGFVGERAAAEDVFQETLLTFFQRLSEFRGEAPVGAWLRQIAISRCLMHLRSPWHRARLRLQSDEDLETHSAPPSTPAVPPEILDLRRALASLTPTARAVVWLFEVEGYSHEEIARLFGRSISFSKSQLARAHARLRDWLERDGNNPACTTI